MTNAVFAPTFVGVKRIVKVHVAPPASVCPEQVLPVGSIANRFALVPVISSEIADVLAPPVFLSVSVRVELLLNGTLPKLTTSMSNPSAAGVTP